MLRSARPIAASPGDAWMCLTTSASRNACHSRQRCRLITTGETPCIRRVLRRSSRYVTKASLCSGPLGSDRFES